MLNRRGLLQLAGLAAAGSVLPACDSDEDARLSAAASSGATARPELPQPQVLESKGGRLALTLTATPGVLIAGRRTSALGFNGTSPGPTLMVRPGDELAIRLVNRLSEPTNLHTHGLRVSPSGSGDNPFLRVDPGEHFDYSIRIPTDHPPGTHWYHPHLHHHVADQLFAGLMGAIVVTADGEPLLGQERLLVLSDITLDAAGGVVGVGAMERARGREGALLLLNGADRPDITVPVGSTQRWRIVNTCVSRIVELRLDGQQMTQVALDGAYLPEPVSRQRLRLAPGNRVDVVLQPGTPGRFDLIADTVDRGGMGMMRGGATAPRVLATVVCEGSGSGARSDVALPRALPAEQEPGGTVTARRRIDLQMSMGRGMGQGMGMSFAIDGRQFDPDRDDQTTALGAVEEWTITNASPMVHPFHLHAWPFWVLESSDGSASAGVAQDVVEVPARGWVRLRIAFTGVSGRSVYHCHILDHEDLGMMATVNVRK